VGQPRLQDPALRKARALLMVERKLHNTTLADIGREFNVTETTVARELQYAKRAGLLQKYEEQILDELVPLAIAAYKTALAKGDTTVADKVFKGLGFLLPPQEREQIPAAPEGGDTLEFYVRRKLGNQQPARGLPAASAEAVVDGSVLEGALAGAAEIEAPVGPARDEGRVSGEAEPLGISADADGPTGE
jgi:hypothetical protein